jgi:hypothetical protein
VDKVSDAQSLLDDIPKVKGIEGYVIRLASGQRIKIKTEWYNLPFTVCAVARQTTAI